MVVEFKAEVTEFARYLKSTPPAQGYTEVMYPGEVEYLREQERRKNGVEVDNKTWKAFTDLAAKYGKEGLVG